MVRTLESDTRSYSERSAGPPLMGERPSVGFLLVFLTDFDRTSERKKELTGPRPLFRICYRETVSVSFPGSTEQIAGALPTPIATFLRPLHLRPQLQTGHRPESARVWS